MDSEHLESRHMPVEIRDIWVHDYIGEPQDKGDEPPA